MNGLKIYMEGVYSMLKNTYKIQTPRKELLIELTEEKLMFVTDILVKLDIPCKIYNVDGSIYYKSK